jgi:serine/threonine protein kinase
MNTPARGQTGRMVLGRYRLVMPLAKGGQGVVYLARGEGAAGFTMPVVIKRVLTPIARDPESIERFVQEARITAQLRHPDIVSILDFEQEGDDSYVMVLEYVHGYDLAKWTRFVRNDNRPFAPDLAAYVTLRVLEALHYSHSLRNASGQATPIIHRDVSPGNVLIDEDGHVKLTDFGIAQSKVEPTLEAGSAAPSSEVAPLKAGIQGKLAYISPELYRGASPSPQSDVYASAVMLHQLLVGKNEFQAKDLVSTAVRVVQHVPTRISDLRKDVSQAASDLIARSLAKDPKERPQSAREFSTELRRAFELDLGELPEKLSRAVRQDFFDPRFPKLADVTDLATIDRAWREVPTARSLSHFPPAPSAPAQPTRPPAHGLHASADMSTRVEALPPPAALPRLVPSPAPGPASPVPPKRNDALPWFLVAAVAVAAAIAFVVTRKGGEERVVFVDARSNAGQEPEATRDVLPERTAPPALPAPPAAAQTTTATPTPAAGPASEPPSSARKGDEAQSLTWAFGARRKEVEACFNKHSAALEGAPRVQVDFEISTAGRVTTAALDPAAIEGSELGRCILKVATSTRFPKQPKNLRFRIPLTARGD